MDFKVLDTKSGYFMNEFRHKLNPLISQHFLRNTHSTVDVEQSCSYSLCSNSNSVDCRGAVASVRDSYTDDPSSIPVRLVLHHGDNRGRHSANHNLLPDMHLRVPVLRVKTCYDSRLV